MDGMTVWLYDCMTAWLHDCMTAWLHDCMTVWLHSLHDCMTAWLHDCMTAWLHDCMTAWLHDCMTAWLHTCMTVWWWVMTIKQRWAGTLTFLRTDPSLYPTLVLADFNFSVSLPLFPIALSHSLSHPFVLILTLVLFCSPIIDMHVYWTCASIP